MNHRSRSAWESSTVGLLRRTALVLLAVLIPSLAAPQDASQPAINSEQVDAVGGRTTDVLRQEQEAREAWLAWRARQAQRETSTRQSAATAEDVSHDVTVRTVANPLTLLQAKNFADSAGNVVIVGEVRNDTASTLSFAKARFTFFNSSGGQIATDYTYVLGSQNARLLTTGVFTNVLLPGAIGFFKLITSIPFSSVAAFPFSSDAETFAYTPPRTALNLSGPITLTGNSSGGTNFSLVLTNVGLGTTAYFARVSLAGYDGGALNDVQTSFARGTTITQCGVTTDTAIEAGAQAPVSSSFSRHVTSIARLAFEWDEVSVSPTAFGATNGGGTGSVSVVGQCAWTAASNTSWITVTSGAAGTGDGVVTINVQSNPSGAPRSGTLTIAGLTVAVNQSATSTLPPTINTHPVGVTVEPGQAATLTITASGPAPLSYQWFIGNRGDATRPITNATSSTYTTPPLLATTRYWVRVSNPGGFADSNAAAVTVRGAFTDTPLTSGVSSVRQVHVSELRARVDALRVRYNLPAFQWTDASLTQGVSVIKAVHIQQLRDALTQVYAAANRAQPVYTDGTLVAGVTTIKAAHIQQLRDAVVALE